jgi:trans-L-3-hydroxyproline dehydratase
VIQQPIVRHYRGANRADVEAAYRADAQPAIAAGYLPLGHVWSQDHTGLLLAVTYQMQAAPAPAATAYDPRPQYQAAPQAGDVGGQFIAQPHAEPGQFAPATNGAASALDAQWLAPVAPVAEAPAAQPALEPQPRYSPPPDMYAAPPDMYAPPAAPVSPAPAATEAPASAAVAPSVGAADDHEDGGASRQTRLTVQTMDLHCAGEPLRIIRSGFPDVPHMPVLERRRWVMENADYVRRAIIQEPRGHRDMYGAILLPPYNDYADMTVLFMHNEGYSTMCGHGVIAITSGLIEEGLFPASGPVTTIRYEVPAGIVAANAATVQLEDGSWAVRGVRFTNVPAYLAAQSLALRPDGVPLYGPSAQYGALSVDIAFGGAYYGIVNAADLGLRVVPEQAEALRHAGAAITEVLRRDHTPQHPTDPVLGFVYGTIIVDTDPRSSPDGRATEAHLRNVTVFADAEVDRSPCGSGTSALLAQLHARGRMDVGQEIVNAGITGEHFLGRIEAETTLGPYRAVSTSVAGTAYVTGYSTFVVDSRDPLGDGFLLG